MTYVPNWGHIVVKSRSARGAQRAACTGAFKTLHEQCNTAVIGTYKKDKRLVPVGCKLEQTKNR